MFINYDVNAGLSINSFRKAGATAGDIGDLAEAVTNGNECVCCDLGGAKDALEDGSYWQGSSVSQDAIEEIHSLICEYERDQ